MGGGKCCRTRITAGGNILECEGDAFTPGATLETVKFHWNSILSSPGHKHCAGDISNMHLESLLSAGE